MNRLLSIDWDAFVPEDPMHDMGHREAPFFLDLIWQTRAAYCDEIKTTGLEKTFWGMVKCNRLHQPLFVSETHLDLFRVLEMFPDIDEVVNVDAHHDCWPGRSDSVGCESWGTFWLKKNPRNVMTWIKPKHEMVGGLEQVDRSLRDRVRVLDLESPKAAKCLGTQFCRAFVCRSGCWTPPWLDAAWLDFVRGSKMTAYPMREKPWDGMEERWTEEQLRGYKAAHLAMREEVAKMFVLAKHNP